VTVFFHTFFDWAGTPEKVCPPERQDKNKGKGVIFEKE
jgi:hypothetical protein